MQMANFAQLDDNNIVMNIVVVNNNDIIDEDGNESEELGIKLLQSQLPGTRWVQTSYNSNIRGSYAGIGDYYNEEYDVFCSPKPYPSWIFNPELFKWDSPTPLDFENEEGIFASWNEDEKKWDKNIIDKPEYPDELLETHEVFWSANRWEIRPKLFLNPIEPIENPS